MKWARKIDQQWAYVREVLEDQDLFDLRDHQRDSEEAWGEHTEWVRFCALHTAHHLAVVRDIRAGGA